MNYSSLSLFKKVKYFLAGSLIAACSLACIGEKEFLRSETSLIEYGPSTFKTEYNNREINIENLSVNVDPSIGGRIDISGDLKVTYTEEELENREERRRNVKYYSDGSIETNEYKEFGCRWGLGESDTNFKKLRGSQKEFVPGKVMVFKSNGAWLNEGSDFTFNNGKLKISFEEGYYSKSEPWSKYYDYEKFGSHVKCYVPKDDKNNITGKEIMKKIDYIVSGRGRMDKDKIKEYIQNNINSNVFNLSIVFKEKESRMPIDLQEHSGQVDFRQAPDSNLEKTLRSEFTNSESYEYAKSLVNNKLTRELTVIPTCLGVTSINVTVISDESYKIQTQIDGFRYENITFKADKFRSNKSLLLEKIKPKVVVESDSSSGGGLIDE